MKNKLASVKKTNSFIAFFLVITCQFSIINSFSQTKQLWGMTGDGGQYNAGTIFSTDGLGDNQMVQYSFYKNEGVNPNYTNMIQASDGKLYGMTSGGGANSFGVIFQYDPSTNTYTKKIDFDGTNGSYPYGSLMQANDGKLYGMTSGGGANSFGVIFQYDPSTNTYTKKIDFNGANGSYPYGSLMQASDGKLYGMTTYGGANNVGAIFQYDPSTNSYTKKIDLSNATGSHPMGSLIQASDGMLYGMNRYGGANNTGVIFQYDPSANTYSKKVDLSAVNGSYPFGSLMQASDGMLYGMTFRGGVKDSGVVFQYDPSANIYTKKIDLSNATGSYPKGSLIQASDGKLYGMTWKGGTKGLGVMFQYDLATSIYTKKIDFNGINGANPAYTNLIEIDISTGISETLNKNQLDISPNPFSSSTTLRSDKIFKNATILVYNLYGQQVKQIKNISGQAVSLSRDNLPGGVYFIRLMQEGKIIATDKLVISD